MNVVEIRVSYARSIAHRIKGLIGKQRSEGLLIKTRFGIHTFGVRFPIDVVVLNNEGRVVKIKKHLKPKRVFFWNPQYSSILELPSGSVEKNHIGVGSKIELSER